MDETRELSFYEAVGGEETFRRLTRLFYEGVAADPELRAVYPSKDLGPAEEHLRLFLIQYWGGPATYNELRGHPRLRMRHARFAIGEAERDAWLHHMRVALDELNLDEALEAQLWDYLVMAAQFVIGGRAAPVLDQEQPQVFLGGPEILARVDRAQLRVGRHALVEEVGQAAERLLAADRFVEADFVALIHVVSRVVRAGQSSLVAGVCASAWARAAFPGLIAVATGTPRTPAASSAVFSRSRSSRDTSH